MRHPLSAFAAIASLLLALTPAAPLLAADQSAKGAIRAPARVSAGSARATGESLDAMIGQMIMVGFLGTSAKDKGVAEILDELRAGEVGGVILLGRNITSPGQLKQLSAMVQRAAREGGQPTALISVDQEGGYVQRLKAKNGHESFPFSARTIAQKCQPDQAAKVYKRLACQLHEEGINVNFGPVVDLDIKGEKNPIIGKFRRSFGADAAKVEQYARWFNSAHKGYAILTAAKHYPGHGSSLTDTHAEFTDISDTWSPEELKPYESLAKRAYADMVMVGHLYHPAFSDGRAPASLSQKAIRGMLRGRIGYKGVVITDDLQMKAVLDTYPLKIRIPMAVNAGNDIVLLSNTVTPYPTLGKVVHDIIRRSVRDRCPEGSNDSCIERRTIEAAYHRIRKMKARLDALKAESDRCRKPVPVSKLVESYCKPVGHGRAGESFLRRQTFLRR